MFGDVEGSERRAGSSLQARENRRALLSVMGDRERKWAAQISLIELSGETSESILKASVDTTALSLWLRRGFHL